MQQQQKQSQIGTTLTDSYEAIVSLVGSRSVAVSITPQAVTHNGFSSNWIVSCMALCCVGMCHMTILTHHWQGPWLLYDCQKIGRDGSRIIDDTMTIINACVWNWFISGWFVTHNKDHHCIILVGLGMVTLTWGTASTRDSSWPSRFWCGAKGRWWRCWPRWATWRRLQWPRWRRPCWGKGSRGQSWGWSRPRPCHPRQVWIGHLKVTQPGNHQGYYYIQQMWQMILR